MVLGIGQVLIHGLIEIKRETSFFLMGGSDVMRWNVFSLGSFNIHLDWDKIKTRHQMIS